MAVYTNDLRLKEIATGDESGTWGTSTNTNLSLIADAFGFGTEAITTNADTHTTTIADGSADPGRSIFLKYTGTLDSACTITIGPNTVSKLWFIENATSGSQNIIIKQGSGATVTIPAGDTKAIYSDGAGSGGAMVDAFASLNVVDLKVEDDLTVTDDLIVNGDIDLEGSIDVNGTANLDVVDIDGAVDMASTLQVDGAITSSSSATITTADNLAQLTLISTDTDSSLGPVLDLNRNPAEAGADDDFVGQIFFTGHNDAGTPEDIVYAKLTSQIKDASDGTEDGNLVAFVMSGGSRKDMLRIGPTESVFNESSNDLDFRVESNGDANAFFVDAGNDKIGVLTNAPSGQFHVYNGMLQVGSKTGDTSIQQNANAIRIAAVPDSSTEWGGLQWYREFSDYIGAEIIAARASSSEDNTDLIFKTSTTSANASERMRIQHDGKVLIGTDSGDSFNSDSILRIGRTGDRAFMQFKTDADQDSGILFGDVDDDVECGIIYEPDKKGLGFTANNGNTRLSLLVSESVVNEDSETIDFRVEGNGEANLLFCDASADRVGIGTNGPSGILHLRSSVPQLYIQSDDGENPSIVFGDASDASRGQIKYTDGDEMQFLVNNLSQALRIESTRKVVTTTSVDGGVGLQINNTSSGEGSHLTFYNASGSPADGDSLGVVNFNGNDSTATETIYANIVGFSTDVTNGTEDGQINLSTRVAGTFRQRQKMDSTEVVFNEESTNVDFRVETDSKTHMLFVDGVNNFVGIGNNGRVFSSSELLSIDGNDPGIGINVGTAAEQAIGIIQSATSTTNFMIRFDKGTGSIGSITHNGSVTAYNTSSDERLKENIKDADDAGELIDSIQVRQFDWKDNGRHQRYGMVAQELNIVAPEACAMGDGEEDIAAVDYSILVPMLLKEIQTLRARVAKLEGE